MAEALQTALELAAQETVASGHPEISPAHLLIGLSRFAEASGASPAVQAVTALVLQEFEALGIEPKPFRRRLRALLGQGGLKFEGGTLHRSKGCKWVFAVAAIMAEHEGVPLDPRHLLRGSFIASSLEPQRNSEEAPPVKRDPTEDLPEEL